MEGELSQEKLKEKSKKRTMSFDIKNIIKEWNFLYE